MNRAKEKAQRLLQIQQLLWAHPEGLTRAEIARRLQVNRSTITRYLQNDQLPPGVYEDDLDGNKLKLDRAADLTRATFGLHEVMAIHLATRLLATRMDKPNPHAASALRKLGQALQRLDQNVSRHLLASADVMDQEAKYYDPVFLDVLQKLSEAWSAGRKVRLTHQMPDGEVFEYKFSPYFIEPYAIGQTVHVIGLREPPGKIRTFKLERLQTAEILHERYEIPPDFNPTDLLRDAWGIWYTESPPVEVKLCFSSRVGPRVRETRWHISQEPPETQDDGSVIWRARVAEPQEMLPWIRGWGADVEVLEPEWLRDKLRSETHKLANLYGIQMLDRPSHFSLWAKAKQTTGTTHPLLYHLIDVGATAQMLWEKETPAGEQKHLADLLGTSPEEAGRFFAYCTAIHDIGKAGPGFQEKFPPSRPTLEKHGLDFPNSHGLKAKPHGHLSTLILQDHLATEFGLSRRVARRLATVIGGHHGTWPTAADVQGLKIYDTGGESWSQVSSELLAEVRAVFNPPSAPRLPDDDEEKNAVYMYLSGFITVADWIGSTETFFAYDDVYDDPKEYAQRARAKAERAFKDIGWRDAELESATPEFDEIFPFSPNALQRSVIESGKDTKWPSLMIVEGPTGMGKTEAAFYLADMWLQKQGGKGIYIAMPTQATSNQLFERTNVFLEKRFPGLPLNVLLLHGNAAWSDQMREIPIIDVGESAEEGVSVHSWFLPRKRSLLAPFGIGTVDQALLSVLQTRHFFLRLYGLSHKVVIFDEVHAYDTYMNQLFQRLLAWLRAMGTSVIVLSATLPEKTRQEMVSAYLGRETDLSNEPYPRLTVVDGGTTNTVSIPTAEIRQICLEWIDSDVSDLIALLGRQLVEGGCAAVICNTVGRAQEIYAAVADAQLVPNDQLILFHARTLFAWRKDVESAVLSRFGKPGIEESPQRPAKSIVVATQVIEQSLDLDFDLLVSELAPIDLLIQRVGRLHRHRRAERPNNLRTPRLVLLTPEGSLEAPDFGSSEFIYERYILWRTWMSICGLGKLTLPTETAQLIEAVYGPLEGDEVEPALLQGLQEARDEMEKRFRSDRNEAHIRLAPPPSDRNLVTQPARDLLDDEDPGIHEQMRAATRLIGPTLSLIALHNVDGAVYLEPEGDGKEVDLSRKPVGPLVGELLQRQITIQHRGAMSALLDQLPHDAWKDSPALRYHVPVVFENGHHRLENGYVLTLDRTLGLQIKKEIQ